MKININQLLVFIIVSYLLLGDLKKIKKKLSNAFLHIKKFINRKKEI